MTKIKICGITNYDDAAEAAALGADYLGYNFYSRSPRFIKKQDAMQIIKKLPGNVKNVGVFVNETIGNIKKIVDYCSLDVIQLSGDESPKFLENLKKESNKTIIKSFRIKTKVDANKIKSYKTDYIMIDSFKNGLYGGTGRQIELPLAENIYNKKLFLAGGLNDSNVGSAIKNLNPFAVDVCSGIESYKGKKDFVKMKNFIAEVK